MHICVCSVTLLEGSDTITAPQEWRSQKWPMVMTWLTVLSSRLQLAKKTPNICPASGMDLASTSARTIPEVRISLLPQQEERLSHNQLLSARIGLCHYYYQQAVLERQLLKRCCHLLLFRSCDSRFRQSRKKRRKTTTPNREAIASDASIYWRKQQSRRATLTWWLFSKKQKQNKTMSLIQPNCVKYMLLFIPATNIVYEFASCYCSILL